MTAELGPPPKSDHETLETHDDRQDVLDLRLKTFCLPKSEIIQAKLNKVLRGDAETRRRILSQLDNLSRAELTPAQFVAYLAIGLAVFPEEDSWIDQRTANINIPRIINALAPEDQREDCLSFWLVLQEEDKKLKVEPLPTPESRPPLSKEERRKKWEGEGLRDPDRVRPSDKPKPKKIQNRDRKKSKRKESDHERIRKAWYKHTSGN